MTAKNAAAKKTTKMVGSGIVCPRCHGDKPRGEVGHGIALSSYGKVAICASCGTDEAMIDAGFCSADPVKESRMKLAIAKALSEERL